MTGILCEQSNTSKIQIGIVSTKYFLNIRGKWNMDGGQSKKEKEGEEVVQSLIYK